MRFRVVQTHRRGIPLERKELHTAPGVVGELLTSETAHARRKGSIMVAQLQRSAGAQDPELLPAAARAGAADRVDSGVAINRVRTGRGARSRRRVRSRMVGAG